MTGPWSTCGQEPWYVENDQAHAYSSVGIAKDGEVKAIAVWTDEHDHADEMVAALNAYERGGTAEPVRYQRRPNPDTLNTGWVEVNEEDIAHYQRAGQEIRALYVGPLPAALKSSGGAE